ncbi:MAG TPA: CDP-archaeol synthase [Vicinamibacterales bacterium]|nr:CDP-archaeol synthase [Vicinamibacterales bacterium]
MARHVDPGAAALFLLATFVVAGCAQVAWLSSPWSRRFAIPIDRGRTFRGRRIFGANKTWRGLIVMVPATGAAFAAVARIAGGGDPASVGLWDLSAAQYAALGAWAGLGFMLGELPNSFVKRQLGIAPGARAPHPAAALWQFVVDRADSGIGMLTALSIAVPTPWQTWALVLLAGWAVHWSFSLVLFWLRVKPRPA